ncbi:MAG TPA: putative Ig domain-containing protein [Deltaproteobacteria bacterium]|nr:putative Ig domain-containing protein [Deltaproteobacteria bacterium]HPR54417.1 putative Ig domain-containing protein [Deltaproteobacteria bacterium]HXK46254.1 putative Ig domain-containing protein [Deltaproteobacteria bacterium]
MTTRICFPYPAYGRIPFKLLLPIFLILLVIGACSRTGSDGGIGNISFSLKMPQSSGSTQYKAALFACDDYGIVDVVAQVTSGDTLVATGGPWPCDTGEGILSGVEEGENYRVTISMRDSQGRTLFQGSKSGIDVVAGTTTDAGTIEMTAMNTAPVFADVANQQVDEGGTLSFTISATDPDGDALTYSATSLPSGAEFDPDSHMFSWVPGYDQGGTHTATFQVTDDGAPQMSDTLTVTISVGDVNQPPVLDEIGTRHITSDVPASFTVTATDPDGDTLTYDIAGLFFSDGTYEYGEGYLRGMSIDPDTHVFTWNPVTQDYGYGEYMVLFRVTDDGTPRLTDYEWVAIQYYDTTVDQMDGSRFPVLGTIGSRQIDAGDTLRFILSATDADSNASLNYADNEISGKTYPDGASLNSDTNEFVWETSTSTSGNFWVRFLVRDAYNYQADFEDVVITVGDVNRPPVLDPIGARHVVPGESIQFIVTATDPENDALTYSVTSVGGATAALPSGASFDSATQVFTWDTLIDDSSGYFRFTVTDANGESDYEDVYIQLY